MTSTPMPRLDSAPGAERRPAAARGAAQAQARACRRPFAPLSAAEQKRLEDVLPLVQGAA